MSECLKFFKLNIFHLVNICQSQLSGFSSRPQFPIAGVNVPYPQNRILYYPSDSAQSTTLSRVAVRELHDLRSEVAFSYYSKREASSSRGHIYISHGTMVTCTVLNIMMKPLKR